MQFCSHSLSVASCNRGRKVSNARKRYKGREADYSPPSSNEPLTGYSASSDTGKKVEV